MNINEIIEKAALIVGRDDVGKFINDDKSELYEDTEYTLKTFLSLLNLVIAELSATFIPMRKRETVETKNGVVRFADLSFKAMEIVGVYDLNGNAIAYEFTPEYIKVDRAQIVIEYEMIPPNYTLGQKIDYTEKEVPCVILAYGLAAEYYVNTGRFEQAVMWHKRYVDAINSLRKTKNVKCNSRSFV
jgi:hypothetical protein